MFAYLYGIWKELDRSIYEGERYRRNMRSIAIVAMLIVVINIVTGYINVKNGYLNAAVTSPFFILAGLVILYFTQIKKNRRAAVTTSLVSVVIIFTYEAVSVTHGFPIFWTLLLPMAFCYLSDVKSGIYLSLYFLALYWVLFFTPLRHTIAANYSEVIAQRFPVLYLVDVILTTFIMVQYHHTTLRQIDDAKQLMEAKEAADKANAAKNDFLANVSHEIRTPINAVLGMNEMIRREAAQAQRQGTSDAQATHAALQNIADYADDVQSAGKNLLSLINTILDFSKIEAGKVDIASAPYSLRELLGDVTNLVSYHARDKGLRFVVDVDETIPNMLRGDMVHLRQVMLNLLTNALKYTEQGSIHLIVRGNPLVTSGGPDYVGLAANTDDTGVRDELPTIKLRITVRDTGIGIRPEDIDKIFSKFQRVDLNRTGTIEGTGLGLAIAHSLVAMMGGSIRVQSEYGAGSTFVIELPQGVVSDEPVGSVAVRDAGSRQTTTTPDETFHAPTASILIVDDTRMNLTVATGLLKATGVQVHTATSGKQAIELSLTNAYDLILMDQRMPGMDGTTAMRRIRGQLGGLNRLTPQICLTADAIAGAKERYLAEGFTDYLAKPVEGRALERLLAKYLPRDKIMPAGADATARVGKPGTDANAMGASVSDGPYASLRASGIDPSIGLEYSANNEDLYRTLLEDYAYDATQKTADLRRYYDAQDWESLAIATHALKGTSRMIGATELSKTAAAMEQAADAGDADAVERGFAQLLASYAELVAAIRHELPLTDKPALDEDDEILEFFPEQ